jgi:hypothetical protein
LRTSPVEHSIGRRDRGEAAAQQRHGRVALARRVAVGQRLDDEIRIDPERQQPALDPLAPPVVERAAVLRERARVARVIDVALPHEYLDGTLDRRVVDVVASEVSAHLVLRPVALAEVAVGEVERALQPRLGIEDALVGGHTHG